MSEVQLRVKHNIATYDLKFNEEETLGTLGHKLLELTGKTEVFFAYPTLEYLLTKTHLKLNVMLTF